MINEWIDQNVRNNIDVFDQAYNDAKTEFTNKCLSKELIVSQTQFEIKKIKQITYGEYIQKLNERHPQQNQQNQPNQAIDGINPIIPNNDNQIDDLPPFPPVWEPDNPHNPVPPMNPDNYDDETKYLSDNLSLYAPFVLKAIYRIEEDSAINKHLEPESDICEIDLEQIKQGEYYYNCPECKGTFGRMSFKIWIEKKSKYNKQCPKCRKSIKQIPQLYVNKPSTEITEPVVEPVIESVVEPVVEPIKSI